MSERIGILGLGYVGLPVALAFAREFGGTVGFDVDSERVEELHRGHDRNQEEPAEKLLSSPLAVTSDLDDLRGCTFFVVAVPTPVDGNNVPDLTSLERASAAVGRVLGRGGGLRDGGMLVDVKSALDPARLERGIQHWSL
jgi:UDP-N-acetyl-D-galactosamine dehydrogenase